MQRGFSKGLALACVGAAVFAQGYRAGSWVSPGSGDPIPGFGEYGDPAGTLGTVITGGTVESKGHPFFEALGTNGRACVTCHQPAWGMSISGDAIRDRWDSSYGTDPLFASFDGANCPDLPQAARNSHSLLLDRGLFRIPVAWPPKDGAGKPKAVEFDIEVVHDPTGCNRSARYGVASGTVNVYRRPRPAANLKYVIAGAEAVNAKTGERAPVDPATGEPSSMNFMADAREASLSTQATSAILGHLQAEHAPAADVLRRIVDFESSVYAAQQHIYGAGFFDARGIPSGLGPRALASSRMDARAALFGDFSVWNSKPGDPGHDAFRASAARGERLFHTRQFAMDATAHAPGARGTCASCHSSPLTGLARNAGWMDIGTTTAPHWTEGKMEAPFTASELPVFKVTCRADAKPHPLGRVVYTTDPGRALISGRCADVGAIVMQQLRGLSARAPYFANGSAETLRDVVEFYNRRYQMKLTEAEKADLVHFLEAL